MSTENNNSNGRTEQPEPDSLLRRLRIDEIKERRRRFHKETAERWILEQQFGSGGGDIDDFNSRGGGGSNIVEKQEKEIERPDRNSFLNAFEFFSRSEGGKGSDSLGGGVRTPTTKAERNGGRTSNSEGAPLTTKRVGLRLEFDNNDEEDVEVDLGGSSGGGATAADSRRSRRRLLLLESNEHEHYRQQKEEELPSSAHLHSPPPPETEGSTSSTSSSSSADSSPSLEESNPDNPPIPLQRPPDVLVLDPIVIITDEPDQSQHPRRRPSSILKKRDSSTTDDNSSAGPTSTTVSFATDIVEANESSSSQQLQEPYRRRSRSYSGSGSSSGRSFAARRNSAEAHYYSSNEDFDHQHSSRGILKHSCSSLSVDGNSDSEFKSILKQPRRSSLGSNIHTVHQTRFSDEYEFDRRSSPSPHQHQRSILKRKTSTSSSQPDVSTASSLRSTASSYCSSRESLHEPDPKPILKKKSSSEEISDSDYNSTSITPPPRPILKNKAPPSSESIPILVSNDTPIKPCLKKPCKSFDESALWPSNAALESTSSIMRKSSPHICSVKKCEEDDIRTYRRGSEPNTSPTMEENTPIVSSRRGSETFYKRKIELGKIDFSSVYEKQSSSDTSPSSGISSPSSSTPTTTTTSSSSPKKSPGHGNTISQKIAALQISGESSWKKRVSKPNPEIEIIDGLTESAEKKAQNGILANRLSMLESSQESWRKRVGEKDAKEFTVQGKLEKAGKKVEEVPSPTKKKSNSFKNVLRGMRGSKTDESISKCVVVCSPKDEETSPSNKSLFQRSKSMRYGRVQPQDQDKQVEENKPSGQHVTVSVIRNDNETFTKFFESEKLQQQLQQQQQQREKIPVIVEDESFNAIIKAEEGRQLLGNKRNVRVARNNKGVKNPIKALAGRLQQQSYVDVNPEIRERENIRRRIQMENSTSATHAHLSIEALAGLASKEDFTSVKLRRAQQEISAQYPYPLLIRVKGKRFVQSRLAAPELLSINSGDNFILITQTKVYHFIGEYSNRMERSKSLDIVAHVVQKKEFGCNLHTKVITLQEESSKGTGAWDSFFEVLGAKEKKVRDDPELLGDHADEEYEVRVIGRNKVWRVITGDELDEKLLPLREYWGCVPKYKLLEPTEVLIFDFGPEMYVWAGSKASVDKKKLGWKLAQELFEMEGLGKEFDDVSGGKADVNGRRPSWCWLRRVNQHMEPILFIEKFFDWPEEVGRIRVGKKQDGDGKPKKKLEYVLAPVQPDSLISAWQEECDNVSLVLEGFDVKRGRDVIDMQERRNYTITTTRLSAWAISEFSKSEVPESQLGHFNAYGTYVIRWQYSINFIGKDLRGNQSRHNCTTIGGRDRCVYFFWHGKKSKITEQGASALMTVELDDLEEKSGNGGCSSRGPQIRVEQNYEPPAFLSLFNGKMFVHDNLENSKQRLYVTLGTTDEEAHFMEVLCSPSSLRNNGSFLLLDLDHKIVYVWIGAWCPTEVKKIALLGANATVKNSNWSSQISKVVTLKQSNETDAFWSCMKKGGHYSNLTRPKVQTGSPIPIEMFRFTCLNGKFEGLPVVSPRRDGGFPVVQEDLYGENVSQPSIFIVLSPDNIGYLWQGWRRTIKREFVPEDEDVSLHDSTPLSTLWPRYRRCSVETALSYFRFKSASKSYLVYAGVEPPEFTQIFPYWDSSLPALREARDYHLAEGKRENEKTLLSEVLQELNAKKTYTVEELMEKPEGVDLSRLEDYVSDEDFERLFAMPRSQFSQLANWRKTELKKAVGLF